MSNVNNMPPIAQIAYSMIEGLIQKVVQEELEEAVREQLTSHNMTGEKGFLRNVVARDIVNAYLGINPNIASQDTNMRKEDLPKSEKSLFSIAKNDNEDKTTVDNDNK